MACMARLSDIYELWKAKQLTGEQYDTEATRLEALATQHFRAYQKG